MSWLRTNRWWLPLLPVLLVALAAASSYRVKDLWYDAGLHHAEATAQAGDYVTATDGYTDAYGATHRTFQVRLSRVGTAAKMPPLDTELEPHAPPRGTEVLVAHLDWKAAPGQSLSGCTVAIVGSDGARYEPPTNTSQLEFCVPERHPGPDSPFTRSEPRGYVEKGAARPSSWSTSVSILAPVGTDVSKVLVWWDEPDYVALPVPPS